MAFAPELRSHARQVCHLYKRACRNLEAYHVARFVVRYHQVLLRARFDENKKVKDLKEQRRLLRLGQDELFKCVHPLQCAKFSRSQGIAGGVAFARIVDPPDWILDYWHPIEKAQYPLYFKLRERRKCEYIEKWHAGVLT